MTMGATPHHDGDSPSRIGTAASASLTAPARFPSGREGAPHGRVVEPREVGAAAGAVVPGPLRGVGGVPLPRLRMQAHPMSRFIDRLEAGRTLAASLVEYAGRDDVIVLGLPRGGVLVAAEVADALQAPLDVFTVRKLGVPWNRELAVGAIATGGVEVLDRDLMAQLGITMRDMQPVIERELVELARRDALFRAGRGELRLDGKVVIVADDGLATGSTMVAAVNAIRGLGAARIVAAAPVASDSARDLLQRRADQCVCVEVPAPFYGVGMWYQDFHDVGDEEVLAVLAAHPSTQRTAG